MSRVNKKILMETYTEEGRTRYGMAWHSNGNGDIPTAQTARSKPDRDEDENKSCQARLNAIEVNGTSQSPLFFY